MEYGKWEMGQTSQPRHVVICTALYHFPSAISHRGARFWAPGRDPRMIRRFGLARVNFLGQNGRAFGGHMYRSALICAGLVVLLMTAADGRQA